MMRSKVVRRKLQHFVVIRYPGTNAPLPVAKRRWFFGVTAQEEQLRVIWACSKGRVNGFAKGKKFFCALRFHHRVELPLADFNLSFLRVTRVMRYRFSLINSISRSRIVQGRIRVAQAHVSHRKFRIQTKRLMKGTRGFYPHVRMKVGLSLIVKSLRLGRGCGYWLRERADPGSQRHWALHDFVGHIADVIVNVRMIYLTSGDHPR